VGGPSLGTEGPGRAGPAGGAGGGPEPGTRLGVFGGTFDPPHAGHLVAAECALRALSLDQVLFVPAARPPHKGGQVSAGPEQRYEMVRLAIAGHPRFAVSRIELDRPGPSYTVDTLAALAEDDPARRLHFITGIDAVLDLPSWREPERLLRMAAFVAVSRPGVPRERLDAFTAALPPDLRQRVRYLEIPAVDVSSSEVRERVRDGRSIRRLVPRAVAAFIARERLYLGAREAAPDAGRNEPRVGRS
jgi:nicotinate-nucleotide adenylyltransferase